MKETINICVMYFLFHTSDCGIFPKANYLNRFLFKTFFVSLAKVAFLPAGILVLCDVKATKVFRQLDFETRIVIFDRSRLRNGYRHFLDKEEALKHTGYRTYQFKKQHQNLTKFRWCFCQKGFSFPLGQRRVETMCFG